MSYIDLRIETHKTVVEAVMFRLQLGRFLIRLSCPGSMKHNLFGGEKVLFIIFIHYHESIKKRIKTELSYWK